MALGLAQNGHSVTMYERVTSTGEVGYAFRITANCDRCLKHLGIDVVEGGAVSATTARIMKGDGKVVMEVQENPDPEKARKGENVFSLRVCTDIAIRGHEAEVVAEPASSAARRCSACDRREDQSWYQSPLREG